MLTRQIRTTFLDYFQRHSHQHLTSSPLIPHSDPTLMFVNAGMVPFKNHFTGAEEPAAPRITSVQKCVRAGGKHNDLENVGHTARHHTFFEMLGNFSFGDYFKDEAIAFSWNLLTKEYDIDPQRLYITHYHEDQEAADIWKKVTGFGSDRLIGIATSDNFWSMGDTGPCGPCSEIFYDHGAHIAGGLPGTPNEDGDRYVEIWNLVFMQFLQHADRTRTPLPKPCIDTGMGIERIAAVLQNTHDNFETDIFKTLINGSATYSQTDPQGKHAISHRVIADHLRACCFLIADGVMPSNEGRGYVLRRIMRRAMRHIHIIGIENPFMHRLVAILLTSMGEAYPELVRAQSLIESTLLREEERFQTTLGKGLHLLHEATACLGSTQTLPGDVAFNLYDTYGFPLDLTQDILKSQNITVDKRGFDDAMAIQKERARKSWVGSSASNDDALWLEFKAIHGDTEFVGYHHTSVTNVICGLFDENGAPVETRTEGQKGYLLSNATPFYAESGGQIGDTGDILGKTPQTHATVTATHKKAGGLHVHTIQVTQGVFTVHDCITLTIDTKHRTAVRAHHSATHLLHSSLRKFLGTHVTQKGSLVTADRLRFDFSHPDRVDDAMRRTIEADINTIIRANASVITTEMTPDEAITSGALALFGEKYSDRVRVIRVEEPSNQTAYSVELCGGTHVAHTGEIGVFVIISESGIAGGIRRIEALAGKAAEEYLFSQRDILKVASETLGCTSADVPEKTIKLLRDNKRLAKDRKVGHTQTATKHQGSDLRDMHGIKVLFKTMSGVSPQDLRPMADHAKKDLGSGIVILLSTNESKASLVVGVTDDLTNRYSAVDLVRAGSEALNGTGGGGRPDMAQAGGNTPQDPARVFDAIASFCS
ncbi:MAG: alanine--tRNA ligase [Alphaproteobacteria bacterium]|nr:MAG: alanine--tRNA ligase [Alphaproteobacteria bacterium]